MVEPLVKHSHGVTEDNEAAYREVQDNTGNNDKYGESERTEGTKTGLDVQLHTPYHRASHTVRADGLKRGIRNPALNNPSALDPGFFARRFHQVCVGVTHTISPIA